MVFAFVSVLRTVCITNVWVYIVIFPKKECRGGGVLGVKNDKVIEVCSENGSEVKKSNN